jgi:hypothetical protein
MQTPALIHKKAGDQQVIRPAAQATRDALQRTPPQLSKAEQKAHKLRD